MTLMMIMMFEYHNEVDFVLCDDTGDYDNDKGGYQKWKKGDTWRKPTKYSAVWISPLSNYHENNTMLIAVLQIKSRTIVFFPPVYSKEEEKSGGFWNSFNFFENFDKDYEF